MQQNQNDGDPRRQDETNSSQPTPSDNLPWMHIAINIIITTILCLFTKGEHEPFIAPLSEVSIVLRFVVTAAIIAFLQVCWTKGWKRGEKDFEQWGNCPDCQGTGRYGRRKCDHRRLHQRG